MNQHGKVFRVGRLDEDHKFVPEPIQSTPLEPEMRAVYFDTRETDLLDQAYYVCGIMGQTSPTNWNVMTGYFGYGEVKEIEAHFVAEMARLREEKNSGQ